jgi:hypothetical protein
MCEDYWCTLHEKHVYDCECPSLDEELLNDELLNDEKANEAGSE